MKHCEKKYIKNQTNRISEERLNFKGGIALRDVDIFIDGGKTRNKVRRIIEKRVSQDYWRQCARKYPDNFGRYRTRHHVSNHLKNIFGEVPCGFQCAC
jgi:hypothetical protein